MTEAATQHTTAGAMTNQVKPYKALGIGDTEHLGHVVGHTFVFEASPRQWQAAWHGRAGNELRIGIAGENARMEMRSKQGFLDVAASLTLTAPQLTALAADILRAAIQLETSKAQQTGGAT